MSTLRYDIERFTRILGSETNIFHKGVSALYDVIGRLGGANNSMFKYSINDLEFYVGDAPSHTIPTGAGEITITLRMKFGSNEIKKNFEEDFIDPFEFDIIITGLDKDAEYLISSWHLDKHIEGGEECKYHHPKFHLTFGGKHMYEVYKDAYGSALIIPSPRIPYPPMDVILGVDFILRNFFDKKRVRTILGNREYLEIVKKSQDRYWSVYAKMFAGHWCGVTCESGCYNQETKKALFPTLNPN